MKFKRRNEALEIKLILLGFNTKTTRVSFSLAFRGKCREEKDLEKFKTDNDIRERTSLETR